MDPLVIDLIIILVLILFNGVFAGSELALVSLRPAQLRRLREEQGERGALVADIAEEPTKFLSTVQIGITLGGFLAAATAAVGLSEPLVPLLDFMGDLARPTAVIIVTIVLTFVTLALGELVPKRIAIQHAEAWSLRTIRLLDLIARVAAPIIWLLTATTDGIVRLLGGGTGAGHAEPGADELKEIIATHRELGATERAILTGAFDIDTRTARDIVVPRRDVNEVPAHATAQDARDVLIASGHSRAPVIDDDEPVGTVHLIDVAEAEPTRPVADCMRDAHIVPEGMQVPDLLRNFQRTHRQLAIVLDEYGTMVGIVTIEDVLEEIVGEIYDEFDRDLNETDPRSVRHHRDGSMTVPGAFPAHDLVDLGVKLHDHEHATVAGIVLEAAGMVPARGDTVEVGGWNFTVLEMDGNAIRRLRVARQHPPSV